MFKQNIGIMIAVAQLAATQQRFAAVQNEFRRFGMDIVAASVLRAQEQGYGADLDAEHTAVAIALLFENFTTVFLGTSGLGVEISDEDAIARCPPSGRRPCTDTRQEHLKENTWISPCRNIFRACSPRWTHSSRRRSSRWNARTCSTSTGAASSPAPIWDNGGIPTREWEDLLDEMRRRADKAGWLRYGLPSQFGGRDGTNLDMAVIREHLAHKGLGLHNDLQDESSIVGNFPQVIMMDRFGTDAQKKEWIEALITGERSMAFGLTEPNHGSDATWLETRAVPTATTGSSTAPSGGTPACTAPPTTWCSPAPPGEPGQARGITAFLVPTDTPGFTVPYYWWTFNMPTDHGEVELKDVRVPADAVLGEVDRGLEVGQTFLHENRIRQAASSLGAAQYCIDRAVAYASERTVFGKPLSVNQAVQWPLVELQTEAQMVRLLVWYAASQLDGNHHMEVSDKVSMANYRANRLVCEAADRAMQVFGGVGYSRHEPFEHIYRHHRRYRITEGAEEIQIRRVAQRLFGFGRK